LDEVEWDEDSRGDGTVPTYSAAAGSLAGFYRYYVRQEHLELVQQFPGLEQIASFLQGSTAPVAGATSEDQPPDTHCPGVFGLCLINVAVASPVTLEVFDETGRHVGPSAGGIVDRQIPGARYQAHAKGAVASLPPGPNYRVVIRGTDNGLAHLRIDLLALDGMVGSLRYPVLEVMPSSVASLEFQDPNARLQLTIDRDGDGTVDGILTPVIRTVVSRKVQTLVENTKYRIRLTAGQDSKTGLFKGKFRIVARPRRRGTASSWAFSSSRFSQIEPLDSSSSLLAGIGVLTIGKGRSATTSADVPFRMRVDATRPSGSLDLTVMSPDAPRQVVGLLRRGRFVVHDVAINTKSRKRRAAPRNQSPPAVYSQH
jgi:hypothetical protein